MAGENTIPTREECLACVKNNRGKAMEKIAELAKVCQKEKEGCLLAQANLDALEATNPEKETVDIGE